MDNCKRCGRDRHPSITTEYCSTKCKNTTPINLNEALNKLGDSSTLPDQERNSLEMIIRAGLTPPINQDRALEALSNFEELMVLLKGYVILPTPFAKMVRNVRAALQQPAPMGVDISALKNNLSRMPFREERMGGQVHKYLDRSEVLAWVDDFASGKYNRPAAPEASEG